MAYCAVSGVTAADWLEMKRLCKEATDYVDKKVGELSGGDLRVLKDSLLALQQKMSAVEMTVSAQEEQIGSLEQKAPLEALTAREVIDIYEGV